jgi:hypothetical protein
MKQFSFDCYKSILFHFVVRGDAMMMMMMISPNLFF